MMEFVETANYLLSDEYRVVKSFKPVKGIERSEGSCRPKVLISSDRVFRFSALQKLMSEPVRLVTN